MSSLTPSSDLRIADLSPDLRTEGTRMKDRYHALAADAGLLTRDGAMDLGKLDDIEIVKALDLATLRALAETADALHGLGAYSELQEAIRADCPFDEFRSQAFIEEALSHAFSPIQWAGVRLVVRQTGTVVPTDFTADGGIHLYVEEDLNVSGSRTLTALPSHLTVHESLDLFGCIAFKALPPKLSVIENLRLDGCLALTSLPPDLFVGGNISAIECASLRTLPPELRAKELDLSRCYALTEFPLGMSIERLRLDVCTGLTKLPDGLHVKELSLVMCSHLLSLPSDLIVDGNIDLRGCGAMVIAKAQILKTAGRIKGNIRT